MWVWASTESWSVWQVDLLISTCSLVVAVCGVLMPWLLFGRGARTDEGRERYNFALSIGNMLSAGVMMSASLVHLLAEAHKTLAAAQTGDDHLPWAMVLCGVGFIFTLIVAQLLEPASEQVQCVDCNTDCWFSRGLTVSPGAAILSKGLSGNFERHLWHDLPLDHSGCNHEDHGGASLRHTPSMSGHTSDDTPCAHHHHHQHWQQQQEEEQDDHHDHYESSGIVASIASALESPLLPTVMKAPEERSGTSFILATGLAIHSVIEGTAIGAQGADEASFKIAAAVLAHKGLTGYAIGTSLLTPAVSRGQFIAFLMLFSLSTPFGILVGSLVSAEVEGASWAAGISATASGTFLYSAVVEVLGNEMRQECFAAESVHRRRSSKVFKIAVFIIGFAAMCVVSKYT